MINVTPDSRQCNLFTSTNSDLALSLFFRVAMVPDIFGLPLFDWLTRRVTSPARRDAGCTDLFALMEK